MTVLVKYEAARAALAEAHQIDEVKDLRDKAEAMAAYARQAKDEALIAWATEIKVRAERKCGEMLRDAAESGQRAKRGQPKKEMSNDTTLLSTLDDIGLSRDQSSRYQKLASIPEEIFEAAIDAAKSVVGEVTTARMLREVKKDEKPAPPKESKPLPEVTQANVESFGPSDDEILDAKLGIEERFELWAPILEASEPLTAAMIKIEEQRQIILGLQKRIDGLINENGAAIRMIKSLRRKLDTPKRDGELVTV